MRVLVLGSGAREHALAARVAEEVAPADLLVVPGNPGIGTFVQTRPGDLTRPDEILALAIRERIDFTIVGPELPLSLGIVDRFVADGRRIFGPTAAAARLESSKAFAKAFMARHRVPTARFETCVTAEAALEAVRSPRFGFPVVLKADGLAAGKGVVIAQTLGEAETAIAAAMSDRQFGAAGDCIVIEECLSGPEVSFFVVCDGIKAVPIGTAQDHKRIFDNDEGPNTGGMGAFAPSPLADGALSARVMADIVDPVMRGMAAEGSPFCGFLYVGLMLTADGPKVIEFNVRFGDPEAQVVLPLIEGPFLPLLMSAAAGQLDASSVRLSPDRTVGVVIASRGYPASSESNRPIAGIDQAEARGVRVMHAGTAMKDGVLVTAGGRVLTVVARGKNFEEAIARAYAGVECISFDGMQYRRDIGRKALGLQNPSV